MIVGRSCVAAVVALCKEWWSSLVPLAFVIPVCCLKQPGTPDLEWHWSGRASLGQLCDCWQAPDHGLLLSYASKTNASSAVFGNIYRGFLLWSLLFCGCLSPFRSLWQNNHIPGGLGTAEIYFSQLWRQREVQGHCAHVDWIWERPFWTADGWLLVVFSLGGRGWRALWGLYESTDLIHDSPLSWPEHLPRVPLLVSSHESLGFQCINGRGRTYSVHSSGLTAWILVPN